jgi:hypothetical protein
VSLEQALESVVRRCPREVTPFLDDITALVMTHIKYDPNFTGDNDEDDHEEMDVEEEEEDDNECVPSPSALGLISSSDKVLYTRRFLTGRAAPHPRRLSLCHTLDFPSPSSTLLLLYHCAGPVLLGLCTL